MSGNYDHPPASSRRPSRPSRPGNVRLPSPHSMDPPARDTFRERYQNFAARFPQTQHLIDLWRSENSAAGRDLDNETDFETFLSEVRAGPETNQLLDQLINHQPGGTPQDNQPSRSSPGLSYLRNLINSGSNRPSSEEVRRAWDALHREVEVRNSEARQDQTRDRFNFEQARAAVDRQIQRLQQLRSDAQESRRSLLDQHTALSSLTTVNPANMESRPPNNRTLRRRSFRPDLRSDSRDTLPTSSPIPQRSPSGRSRIKRRKLDADDNREGTGGFNYGHHGQVVPGALKMEIASCDGGIYDLDGEGASPDNILRNDQTVYCTKSDRCNLILRHRGEAPFCLKKLVIKAPGVRYDSPIQEGMVFVSMNSDDLLARTAHYQIQYSNSSSRRRRHLPRRSNITPSMEYLTGYSSPLQSLERTVLMGPDSQVARDSDATGGEVTDSQTEFRVTIDDKDTGDDNVFVDREGDDVPIVSEVERVPIDDDPLSSSSGDDSITDDDEDEESTMNNFNSRRRQEMRRQFVTGGRRSYSELSQRRRQHPSLVDPLPQSSSAPPDTGVLKPHARFFIEREKNMVSIKFDPPPSGRFILVKLWSPRDEGNIDIQSIIAHGYAGPRFFPSGGLR